ncbi:MAG: hypothetical protein K1000chlam2_01100 [Chlamydiae bacterium]|nr:hypothetical protein [Chlamydiota bacterium]
MHSRIIALPISLALFIIMISGYEFHKPAARDGIVLNSKEPIQQSIEQQIIEQDQISEETVSAFDEIVPLKVIPELVPEEDEAAQVEMESELASEEPLAEEMEQITDEVAQIEVEPELVPEEYLAEEMEQITDEVAQIEVEPELVPEEPLAEEMEQIAEETTPMDSEEPQASDEIAMGFDMDGWAGPGKYSGVYFSSKQSYMAWRSKFHRYCPGKKKNDRHQRAIGIYKENK